MPKQVNLDSNAVLEDMKLALKGTRSAYADGLYDWQTDLRIQKTKEREDIATRSIKGISFRAFTSHGWVYVNGSKTDHTSIRRLASRLNKFDSKKLSSRLTLPEPSRFDKKATVKEDPRNISNEDKLRRLRDLFKLTNTMSSKIVDVHLGYSEALLERVLVTSGGVEAHQVIPRTRASLVVVVRESGSTEADVASFGGVLGYEVMDNLTEQNLRSTVESALEQLSAISPPPGPHKVILDPGVVGVVCHESFGHGLEADQVLRERSYLKDMLGRKVASDLVTIYEDPSLQGAHGSYYVDDDGVTARKNTLVENGKLVSFLHDIETAAAMKARLTGSSRTQNAARRRFIRMSNTYAKPGDWDSKDLIKDTKDGILLMHWRSGMEDPLGGGMQVVAGKGYVIKNGEKTTPIKSPTLTGRVLDVLGGVDAVSRDGFVVESGNCGKGPEDYVPDGTGGTWWRTTAVVA